MIDTAEVNGQLQHLFEPELLERIAQEGSVKEFEPGEELLDIGEDISFFPIVTEGSLKVMTEDDEGRELLLYYLESGDTCAMSMHCCLHKSKSKIRVVAEGNTRVIMVPIERIEQWIVDYPSWRRFIFDSYQDRLTEMLDAIDKLAFQNLEQRLYDYLRDKVLISKTPEIRITHQEIANELNTSRVVVSRLMKKLEQQEKIRHQRNCIVVNEFA